MRPNRQAQPPPFSRRLNPPVSGDAPHSPSRPTLAPGRPQGDDAGLTSLEWLLLVGAVAGLAALGVVMLQQVVGDSAERVATHSARQEAASIAAREVMHRWRLERPVSEADAARINREYTAKCYQLDIIFEDVTLSVDTLPGRFDANGLGWHPDRPPWCILALPKSVWQTTTTLVSER